MAPAGAGALRATEAFAAGEPAAMEAILRHSFRSQFRDRSLAEELAFHIGEDYLRRIRQFGFIIGDLTTFDLMEALRDVRRADADPVRGGRARARASVATLSPRQYPAPSV